MRNVENSVLQSSFRIASELKYFDIQDLMEALPNAKRKTLERYLTAMLKNGNIVRDTTEYSHFIFVDDKPIKTKIGE